VADRERLVELARAKPVPPYTLDDRLTFFCPRENLAALDLPTIRAFHRWTREQYRPARGEPAILLLLPCQRVKPYSLSAEHRAVNGALLKAGYRPTCRGDWPEALTARAPADLLSNAPLRGACVRIDRAVISEPLGIVPYEAIYTWRGKPSIAARYDDPGLFEHRGLACPWREDCESRVSKSGAVRWGEAEREAYVATHNRLVAHIAAVLDKWRGAYRAILAYVAPGLTHRSFLGGVEERRAAGIPGARRVRGQLLRLESVADRIPGAVRLVPDGDELRQLRSAHGGRLAGNVLSTQDCLGVLMSAIDGAAA
jgi:hypothetical protein